MATITDPTSLASIAATLRAVRGGGDAGAAPDPNELQNYTPANAPVPGIDPSNAARWSAYQPTNASGAPDYAQPNYAGNAALNHQQQRALDAIGAIQNRYQQTLAQPEPQAPAQPHLTPLVYRPHFDNPIVHGHGVLGNIFGTLGRFAEDIGKGGLAVVGNLPQAQEVRANENAWKMAEFDRQQRAYEAAMGRRQQTMQGATAAASDAAHVATEQAGQMLARQHDSAMEQIARGQLLTAQQAEKFDESYKTSSLGLQKLQVQLDNEIRSGQLDLETAQSYMGFYTNIITSWHQNLVFSLATGVLRGASPDQLKAMLNPPEIPSLDEFKTMVHRGGAAGAARSNAPNVLGTPMISKRYGTVYLGSDGNYRDAAGNVVGTSKKFAVGGGR